jgi:hypothetical protein
MTLTVQTTNSIGAGTRVTLLTALNTFVEAAGVSIIATDASDGIFANVASAAEAVQINGQVIGVNAINITPTTSSLFLLNNASGLIDGDAGYGVQALGYSVITNYGQITGTNACANLASGTFYNYGTISAGSFTAAGIRYSDQGMIYNFGTINASAGIVFGASSLVNWFYNSGTILGNYGIIDNSQNTFNTDVFYNTGTIVSSNIAINVSGPEKINFTNSGSITGIVSFGSGATIFDSTLGQVFGNIIGSSGGNTIVGGTNGGAIYGGSGTDILYANTTQTAANNAAHTTLDGSGGINALYGDGAFTTFMSGDANGGYNQIWGGASQMAGVSGYTNNTLSFANAPAGVFVDLLNGHNAYVGSTAGGSWAGTGTYEDSIIHVPNVIGSAFGDVIQADSGTDSITGGGKADQLYAGSGAASQDTFVYNGYSDSNTVTGYDTIVGFKIGADKIDLSALHTDGSHLAISTAGTSNTLYVEQTAGTFNAATDLAMIVNTSAAGGLHASDFVF